MEAWLVEREHALHHSAIHIASGRCSHYAESLPLLWQNLSGESLLSEPLCDGRLTRAHRGEWTVYAITSSYVSSNTFAAREY